MLESNSGEEKLSVKHRSSYAGMRVEWLGTLYQSDQSLYSAYLWSLILSQWQTSDRRDKSRMDKLSQLCVQDAAVSDKLTLDRLICTS